MSTTSIQEQIAERVAKLPPEDQKRVLAFVDSLPGNQLHGVPGANWKPFIGSISAEDLDLMEKAIEEECERIDPNEW